MHITTLAERPDIDGQDRQIISRVQDFTMTSVERLAALIDAVRYISTHQICGSIVECGVWRGGSMMAAALTLLELNDSDRNLYLYDTFEGMPQPDDIYDHSFDDKLASSQLRAEARGTGIWCKSTLEDVTANLYSTGYAPHRVKYVKGKVELTIPEIIPTSIALLRLDTDWYESTRHELQFLFPLIAPGGFLIIDDYGHWKGARRACDDYLSQLKIKPFMHRIDYTGRILQLR